MSDHSSLQIFGASGDLTSRKLIPALYQLFCRGFLSPQTPIIGVARREKTHKGFRAELREALERHVASAGEDRRDEFLQLVTYERLDIAKEEDYHALKAAVEARETELAGEPANSRVIYLAIAPSLFAEAVEGLTLGGFVPDRAASDQLRVVVEKPFGTDLASAQALTQELSRHLHEDQIYRIDHYLGKETVQNILMFRFGNAIFEPLLNRNHVDHVQITVAESQGIEGGRGAYYDQSGALRDVLQNHVLQLLCLVAMEPPALFQAREIRDEKMKVLQALSPGLSGAIGQWAVRGQYAAGLAEGTAAAGYREEDRVSPQSFRETFVAMRVAIDNWRWAGVPFFLRTGKRLPARVTEIAIQFKHPPMQLFNTVQCEGDLCDLVEARPNQLILRIQPDEGISLRFSAKRPGMQYQVQPVTMDFEYEDHFHEHLPEAYERLLLDVLRGDSTLFTRSDELEAAWAFVNPVLKAWESSSTGLELYPAGTWGPNAADRLIAAHGASWRSPRG